MHRKWLNQNPDSRRITSYHPRIKGFQERIKELKEHILDNLSSTARIPLPFPVQTKLAVNRLHFSTGKDRAKLNAPVRILYVDMEAYVEDYAVQNDSNEFEDV